MTRRLSPRAAMLPVLAVLALTSCGTKQSDLTNAYTGPTPATHMAFPIAAGPHAVDCAQCHGTFPSFKQFDCLGCHTTAPTAAVHTTTVGYAYDSTSCYGCHSDPSAHPFDHAGVGACATCHASGAAYAALPVAGFTHPAMGGADCATCHATTTWSNVATPAGLVFDPAISIAAGALLPRWAATSIVALSPQQETLPMAMSHSTSQVAMAGVACSSCHADAAAGVFYPGRLHDSLANLALPQPVACSDCHAGSVPTGFVGPTATSPARMPASGEMRHDAVAWSRGVPTATPLVTVDCGACHLSPSATLAATWATGLSGTAKAQYHASLAAAQLPGPTSCLDCHANSRPASVLTSAGASLPAGISFDHAAASALGDCAACHGASATAWTGGRFHLAGGATPASCLPCHEGERPTSTSGWTDFATSPFDYVANQAGIAHGDDQDCAVCHGGPGTGGSWGGSQTWVGGHFSHGPTTVAATTCSACHLTQRPDSVLGQAAAAAALSGFDHAVNGPGDCVACHQATVSAGSYVNYFGPGGTLPGGDWKGGVTYPGDTLAGPATKFVTVNSLTLSRTTPGGPVTGMTSSLLTLHSGMLHVSPAVPAQVSPGPAASPDQTTCWHCHTHDASGTVTSYVEGVFHASLTSYSATVAGPVTPLQQPTGRCGDCHWPMRPPGIVELSGSDLEPMDHVALFTGTVTIGGQVAAGAGDLDCSTCHHLPGDRWTDGTFHASIGGAVPADCVACHYPLMADAPLANPTSGVAYAMAHASPQLRFQACATCHTTALAQSTRATHQASDWRTGTYHASVPSQPTACLDCHGVSEPAAGHSTQSSWTYLLAAGGTSSNGAQWMNHGAAAVAGTDCVTCHAADAKASGSAWSKATLFHGRVASTGACGTCHGLANGGGSVPGTNNNLPAGLTSSTMTTSAASDPLTGVPVGTGDRITHADVNVSGHDCAFCHTQAGRSTAPGIQGAEWARATFHASFSAATPLVLNGTTGRCSNCHLNVKPGATFTAFDHSSFTAASGTQDCSACHSWPGTGTPTTPNWLGASGTPQYIAVGGFAIPQPPAAAPTTQAGIANLPHPVVASGTSCATCHTGGVGGKGAIGYDHASPLVNSNCSSCHEAGANLVGTAWNRSTTQTAGAGDTRPFTLTSIVAHKGGPTGDTCTVTAPNHFYPVDCSQCHAVPTGTGAVATGTTYTARWYFPHTQTKMSNPSTCNLCHTGSSCSK